MATIKDVAQAAGVSVATVSYVINDSAPVSQPTRERVLAAIQALGYRPHQIARNLQGQRTMTLACILPLLADLEVGVVLQSLMQSATKAGYALLLQTPSRDLKLLGRADGCVLFDRLPIPEVPHVWAVWPPSSSASAVVLDGALGVRHAVAAWRSMGFRRIGLVLPPSGTLGSARWYLGYRRALQAAGIAFDPTLLVEPDSTTTAPDEVNGLLAAADPEAVIVVAPALAVGVDHAFREAGQSVAVMAGFDHPLVANAGISALHWPLEQWGTLLVERLLALLHEPAIPPTRRCLAPRVLIR